MKSNEQGRCKLEQGGVVGEILLNYQWNLDVIRLACVQSRNTCCDTHLSTGDVW